MAPESPRPSAQQRHDAGSVLTSAPIAYLAVADEAGPYVVPVCFAWDPAPEDGWGRILFHTGEGRKSRALAADSRACLAVVVDAAFTTGPEPCDDAFNYRSVLIEGRAALLSDPLESREALQLIVAKYDPAARDRPFAEAVFADTLVYSLVHAPLSHKVRDPRS